MEFTSLFGRSSAAVFFVQLSYGSEEQLEEHVRETAALEDHSRSRRRCDRWQRCSCSPSAAILFGGLANVWLAQFGHTGAKATWERVQKNIDKGGGKGGEDGG